MYEDLTNETFEADGEFWESVTVPWDDYDDYKGFKYGWKDVGINNDSSEQYNETSEGNDIYTY